MEETNENVSEKKNYLTDVKLPVKPRQELLPYEKENYSSIEKAIIELSEEMANLSELKDAIEQSFKSKNETDDKFQSEITAYFNSLRKEFDEFNSKFTREIDYTRELDLKIQNNEYRGQIYLLDKSLNEERAKITITIDEISVLVKSSLETINAKCSELQSADKIIQDSIMKFRADSVSASENEYKALKQNCENLLNTFTENSQKTLEIVKKQTIDFLTQCQKENKELILKVPAVKGKLTSESWLVITFGCIGIASLLLQLFMR